MLHALAHLGYLVALFFVACCTFMLLVGLLTALDVPRHQLRLRHFVWEVPVIITGLGGFWAAVAYGLNLC